MLILLIEIVIIKYNKKSNMNNLNGKMHTIVFSYVKPVLLPFIKILIVCQLYHCLKKRLG